MEVISLAVSASWTVIKRKYLPAREMRATMIIEGDAPAIDGDYEALEIPVRFCRRNVTVHISGTATVKVQVSSDKTNWVDWIDPVTSGVTMTHEALLRPFLRLVVSGSSGTGIKISAFIEATGGVA